MIRRLCLWGLNRYWRILIGLAVFIALWIVFRQWESTRDQDKILLYAMAAGFAVTVLMQIRYNEKWSLIDVGVLFLFFASAFTWYRFGRIISTGVRLTEAQNDLIRALFVAALLILLVGYPAYIWQRRRRRKRVSAESSGYIGVNRRQRPYGRRATDKFWHRHRKDAPK